MAQLGLATVQARVVVAVCVPEVPPIVSVALPRVAVLLAVSVSVVVPVAVGFGEKDAVTPAGRPETANRTLPANPFKAFT